MNNITLAMPYYDNPKMLRHHLGYWRKYPKEIAERLLVIIIDDASPKYPARDVLKGCDLPDFEIRIYRVKQNIPWNFPGVRNLAFTVAADGWIFATDVDHVVPAESMIKLFAMNPDPECYYMPRRFRAADTEGRKLEKRKCHSDSYIMTRDMYWEAGGYDEDFSGHYGGSSFIFRRCLNKVGQCVELESIWLMFFDVDVIDDSQVLEWDHIKYHMSKDKKLLRKKARAGLYKPVQPLRFDWERVA